MRDHPRHPGGKDKAGRRSFLPPDDHWPSRDAVKSRFNFNGPEVPRIALDEVGRFRASRIKSSQPILTRPAGSSHVKIFGKRHSQTFSTSKRTGQRRRIRRRGFTTQQPFTCGDLASYDIRASPCVPDRRPRVLLRPFRLQEKRVDLPLDFLDFVTASVYRKNTLVFIPLLHGDL